MQRSPLILIGLLATALTACSSGNVKSARDHYAPPAPTVQNPLYDPYMPYGTANATWRAPSYNRAGTIVHPTDPGADQGRAPYEQAPWATGAGGRPHLAPPGTF
jgi:hypothetical protein